MKKGAWVLVFFVLLVSVPLASAGFVEDVGGFIGRLFGLGNEIEGNVYTFIYGDFISPDDPRQGTEVETDLWTETYLITDEGIRYKLNGVEELSGRARIRGQVGEKIESSAGEAYDFQVASQNDVKILEVSKEVPEKSTGGNINFEVVFDDPEGLYSAWYDELTEHTVAAGEDWAQYFQPSQDVTIKIRIRFSEINTAFASSDCVSLLRIEDGLEIYEVGTEAKIRTGVDCNDEEPDGTIVVGIGNLLEERWWFDPNPYARTASLPADKHDAYSTLLHELGHVFAFQSFMGLDKRSTYDLYLVYDGDIYFFAGSNAMEVYGGQVPLTFGMRHHYGNRDPRPGSDLTRNLMCGVCGQRGIRDYIAPIDLAIIQDSGMPISTQRWPLPICPDGKMLHTQYCADYVSITNTAGTNFVYSNGEAACQSLGLGCAAVKFNPSNYDGNNNWYQSDVVCDYNFSSSGRPTEWAISGVECTQWQGEECLNWVWADRTCENCTYRAVCETACPNPQPEVCDGIDNDCDGELDEGTSLSLCGDSTGTFQCVLGRCIAAQQCPDSCSNEGFECGIHAFCGNQISCGSCGAGEECVSGQCVVSENDCENPAGNDGQWACRANGAITRCNKTYEYGWMLDSYCSSSGDYLNSCLNSIARGTKQQAVADCTPNNCVDECAETEYGCGADGTQRWGCVLNNNNGCYYKQFWNCPAGETCQGSYCAVSGCTDADSADGFQFLETFVPGIMRMNGVQAGNEVCMGSDRISETYCENGVVKYKGQDCDFGCSGTGSLDVKCGLPSGACSSSDVNSIGGPIFSEKGETVMNTGGMPRVIGRDSCTNGNTLSEHYCANGNTPSVLTKACSDFNDGLGDFVCRDGACVRESCSLSCSQLGVQCGTVNLCGVDVECGSCSGGNICFNNDCVVPCADTDSSEVGLQSVEYYQFGQATFNSQTFVDYCWHDKEEELVEYYCYADNYIQADYKHINPELDEAVCYNGALFDLSSGACVTNEHCAILGDSCEQGTCVGGMCDYVLKTENTACSEGNYNGKCDAAGICNCYASVPDDGDNDCDGIDDDCSGIADEDFVGVCGGGSSGGTETCDGEDNNNDGTVDEGFGCGADEKCVEGSTPGSFGSCRKVINPIQRLPAPGLGLVGEPRFSPPGKIYWICDVVYWC